MVGVGVAVTAADDAHTPTGRVVVAGETTGPADGESRPTLSHPDDPEGTPHPRRAAPRRNSHWGMSPT